MTASSIAVRVATYASEGRVFLHSDAASHSYLDLHQLALRHADWWTRQGERVAFGGTNALQLAAWALAAEMTGRTLVILPRLPDLALLQKRAGESGASHLVGATDSPVALRRDGVLDRLAGLWSGGRKSVSKQSEQQPFAVLFTSGSQGRPKGVRWSHRAVTAHLETYRQTLGYTPGERLFNALPLHHTDGFFHGPLLAMWAGLTLVRPERPFSAAALAGWAALARQAGPDVFVTVPTMLAMLDGLEGNPFLPLLKGIRLIVSSAEPLPSMLGNRIEATTAPVANIYGMTETINGGLFRLPRSADAVDTVGRPVDIEARLADDGRLELRGPALADGYEIDGIAKALPRDDDGWWRTSDLAEIDTTGAFRILGRADDAVHIGGVTVHPSAVAAVASGVPGVAAAAVVIARSAGALGESVLTLHIETAAEVDESLLRAALARDLAGPAMPKAILQHRHLPRLASGKVDRSALAQAPQTDGVTLGTAADDLHRQLLDIARTAFNLRTDHPLSLDMGPDQIAEWDSFGHLNLALAIESAFGFRMHFDELASARTLADFHAVVERHRATSPR